MFKGTRFLSYYLVVVRARGVEDVARDEALDKVLYVAQVIVVW